MHRGPLLEAASMQELREPGRSSRWSREQDSAHPSRSHQCTYGGRILRRRRLLGRSLEPPAALERSGQSGCTLCVCQAPCDFLFKILDSLHTMSIISRVAATPEHLPKGYASPRPTKPILKWAGGKQALAQRLVQALPTDFHRYFEPFVGGASVFLQLQPKQAVLSDQNDWLMDTYVETRDHCDQVAAVLLRLPNTRRDYLRIRSLDPRRLHTVHRAAQLIYLNKTCFRGLFRVNRVGQFNVPYGEYNRRYFDPENLRRVSQRLEAVDLRRGDFEFGLDGITAGDFAYLDPP